ncbi:hypothetical protein VMHJH1_09090 [Streptococcus uberis]|uniref:hypothetical protein n=1 Tax=Streptococcus uberis TaxID=1349 RepID=UPI00214FDAB8|nr:hypothetical protein [Streptococcus uberis]MCR4254205.1 hypothetical protein [Streptococcus uberis]MCR4256034.1 hypothetical protein [Streptococcus uberis]MCR4260163.1 hypothetical protein [Streptococcus uberis]MCR4262353.1 hypothetical protein [Streptococcus uberis]
MTKMTLDELDEKKKSLQVQLEIIQDRRRLLRESQDETRGLQEEILQSMRQSEYYINTEKEMADHQDISLSISQDYQMIDDYYDQQFQKLKNEEDQTLDSIDDLIREQQKRYYQEDGGLTDNG